MISGKLEGVSAGFVVRDYGREVWFVKLDHPAFPELSTSAEVIASRLLWLAGYHVPAMHVLDVELSRLVLDPKATTQGSLQPLDTAAAEALARCSPTRTRSSTGRIRVLLSRSPRAIARSVLLSRDARR